MPSEYDIVGIFQDIELELIKSMKRNMKRHLGEELKEGINWSQWQAEMLNGLAEYRTENAQMLKGYYSLINNEIEELIQQAYATGESEQEIELLEAIRNGYKVEKTGVGTDALRGDFFKVNKEKLNALINSTTNDFKTAEKAILRLTDDVYRKTIFKTQMFYNMGATSLWQAVDMATKNFLSAGINCIQYKNGARVNIASYAEMALRTANKRANLMGSANKREEWGIHTVKITAHNSACPMCVEWQGKVYIDDVYGAGTPLESKQSGYPLLSYAVKGGMFHPNCKNGLSTYYEGINQEPKAPTQAEKDEMARRYNLQQEQRLCERNIRKYKRLENGCLDPDDVKHYTERKQAWIDKYNELIADNADILRAEPARLKLYGINATDLKPAIKATQKAGSIATPKKVDIMIDKKNAYDDAQKIVGKYGDKSSMMLLGNDEDLTKYAELMQKAKGYEPPKPKIIDYTEQITKNVNSLSTPKITPKTITKAQEDAISSYSRSGYSDINNYLRFGTIPKQMPKSQMLQYVDDLNALLNANPLQEEIFVKRGINTRALQQMLGTETITDVSAVGKVITDKGFMSTTPYKMGGFGGNAQLFIKCPKGTKGTYIADWCANPAEKEFLIAPNQKMIVRKIETEMVWDEPHYKVFVDIIGG